MGSQGGLVLCLLKSSRGLVPSVLLLCHLPGVALDYMVRSGSLADVHLTASGRPEEERAGWSCIITAACFLLARLSHMATLSIQGKPSDAIPTEWLCILLKLRDGGLS